MASLPRHLELQKNYVYHENKPSTNAFLESIFRVEKAAEPTPVPWHNAAKRAKLA
jgi:hypothetical protein